MKYKTRYHTMYWTFVQTTMGTTRAPDAHGFGNNLNNAIRNSAGRCAIENYRQAAILDRRTGSIVRVLRRTESGITVKKIDGSES